jgi:hypothetical protein
MACTECALGGVQVLGKIVRWGLLIFVVFYVVTEPAGAAGLVHGAIDGLHTVATSLATFVNSL